MAREFERTGSETSGSVASDAFLRLHEVSRSFGKTAAVNSVSLAVRAGEVLSLVGPSGCGKSTLLRMIAGVEHADQGQIVIDGIEVDGARFVQPEERSVGFVFHDYALFPHLTVRENVLFGLKRLDRSSARTKADAVIERIGIMHLAERYPASLSGGEQQRVALARALAPDPKIVLMDEPFSNLDQGLRAQVRGETLALLKGLETTVVLVTHDPQEALSAADQVVLMKRGEVIQAGSPYDLYDRPASAYAAEFFAPSNKVPGVLRGDHVDTPLGAFSVLERTFETSSPIVYIRPHMITLSPDGGELVGKVERRVFSGDTEEVVLRIEGLHEPLRAVASKHLPLNTDTVGIHIERDKVLMFDPS